MKTYQVGNLSYTPRGLYILFFWLLLFDFCFQLMEVVLGPIVQLRMKSDLHADPFLFTIFLVTGPSILNFILNPIISIKSDRYRGRRGRRIPFLLFGAPLVCACIALLGFGNEIASWLHSAWFSNCSPETVTIWTFGVLFLLLTFTNLMTQIVFYYLFNDVVPENVFVRFMAYMRVVSTLAGMVYSWFIFGFSNKWGPLNIDFGFLHYHCGAFWFPKLILLGASIFYLAATFFALLHVREPNYPPPPPLGEGDTSSKRMRTTLRTLVGECFGHRFYIIYFITMAVMWMSYQMGQFQNPMRVSLGIDLHVLGKINACTGFISMVVTLIAAQYGDRFKPLPMMVFAMTMLVITSPIALLFLVPGLSAKTYLGIEITRSLVNMPIIVVMTMAESPLAMSILPRDRFGQFCAAQSMLRMIFAGILGSLLAGWLMRVLEHHCGAYALRFCFVWSVGFQALAMVCYYQLYRLWKKLGGGEHFHPPDSRGPAASVSTATHKGDCWRK